MYNDYTREDTVCETRKLSLKIGQKLKVLCSYWINSCSSLTATRTDLPKLTYHVLGQPEQSMIMANFISHLHGISNLYFISCAQSG